MTIWLDNQLPPALASRARVNFGIACTSVRDLALQRATDLDIFRAARDAGALVMIKDADVAALVHQFGAPLQIVLVTCGNTSNAHLREVLGTAWPTVVLMLERGRQEALAGSGGNITSVLSPTPPYTDVLPDGRLVVLRRAEMAPTRPVTP